MLYASFFPMNWGWLGWVALVPMLNIITAPSPARVYLPVWLGGMTFGLAALQWVRLASEPMFFCWIGLALLISIHFLGFAWLTRRLTQRAGLSLLLVAPTVWTALEFGRAHLGIGFPWYYLGHSQHDALAIIQIADIFGAYGVSFLVMMVNVVIWQILVSRIASPETKNRLSHSASIGLWDIRPAASVTLLLLAGTLIYGWWRLQQADFGAGPRLALLQGNLPQFIRNDPGERLRTAEHFGSLARQASAARPDLIVWSETSCCIDWTRIAPNCPASAINPQWQQMHDFSPVYLYDVIFHNVPALLGLESFILDAQGKSHKYCSALLVTGDAQALNRYDKMYRIPFGEYIPWSNVIPIMKWFSPYEGDYEGIAPGKDYTTFTIPGTAYRFAALICYEDSVPHLAPEYLRRPEPPDFFVNISNDGWFRGSSEHEQHLVAARFRAIECRRPMARSVNMGVSAVIDGNGRIVALPGKSWAESKSVATVVTAAIPLDRRSSLYVLWRDILPWLCSFASLGGLLISYRRPQSA
jgi:apolipoprotein N-acyltransferase